MHKKQGPNSEPWNLKGARTVTHRPTLNRLGNIVMPRLGYVEAWIETAEDETPFEEHNTSTHQGKRVDCFIESKTGAGFNVVVHLNPDYRFEGHDSLAIELYVDGQAVDNMLFGHPDATGRFRGGVISPTTMRPFQFGATVFTGDSSMEYSD
jgi:hypothetical protein